jgi:hypothetical protein
MSKRILLLTLTVCMSACAALDRVVPTGSAPRPSPTMAPGSTQAASETPTVGTATYTSTPTAINVIPTRTGTITPATATFTPLPLILDTPTVLLLVTEDSPGEGFNSLSISGNEIYWGICKHGSVKITAEVTEPDEVYSVVLFVRLMDTESPDTTPWSKGAAMDNPDYGVFTYLLRANSVPERKAYMKAWVFYQLVATDLEGKAIGRTRVFTNSLVIGPCR